MQEIVLLEAHPSWKCLIPDVLLIPLAIGMFTIWVTLIKMITTKIRITNKSVHGEKGFLKTESMESPLNAVTSVKIEKNFFGNILNYGTIHINTAGGNYTFDYINKPEQVKNLILNELK